MAINGHVTNRSLPATPVLVARAAGRTPSLRLTVITEMNLLLISCDQWRADALSCAGHPVLKTPNMDALAAEGVRDVQSLGPTARANNLIFKGVLRVVFLVQVRFAKHYGQSAPCSPGRASLYTGLYAMNHRIVSNSTPLEDRHANWGTLQLQSPRARPPGARPPA